MGFRERFQEHHRLVFGLVSVIAFFILWEFLLTYVFTLNTFFMSKPTLMATAAKKLLVSGELWKDLYISGRAFFFGFIGAVVVGIPVGVVMGWRRRVAFALDPLLTAMYASPLVALAPLLIVMFGVGVQGKAILIFLLAVFPFIFNAFAGVRSVEPLLINVVRSLGGKERDLYFKVILPSTLPYIVAGARIAIGRGIVGIIVGEFYAASEGIGHAIAWYGDMYLLSEMFVSILVLMVIAVAFTEGLRWAQHAIAPWKATQETR
ncbi:MAG: ABC transporter permease [Deltaproteobacteria bacterium]|nr:ABC transporter permease [Deltaproteobacteria bacterium]